MLVSDVLNSYFYFEKPWRGNVLHTFYNMKAVGAVIQDHKIKEKVQPKHLKIINSSEDVKENLEV